MLVLDLDQSIKDHRTTLLQVHLVGLSCGLALVFIVSVDFELYDCNNDIIDFVLYWICCDKAQ